MKYSLMINLDSRDLQIFDGVRIVGNLVKKGEAFVLTLSELREDEVREILDSVLDYTRSIGKSLISVAYDLPGRTTRSEGLEIIRQIATSAYALVHLGCGAEIRANWLNIDYKPEVSEIYTAQSNFLNWDLRTGLPLPDSSVDVIYSSHFFEHLTFDEATNLLRDCHRVLRPSGRFRAMLPKLTMFFAAYVNGDEEFFREAIETWHLVDFLPISQRGKIDVVSRAVYEFYTHKYLYDYDNFARLLNSNGFTDVVEASHDRAIDSNEPIRVRYSFYIDAKKAAANAEA